MNSHKYMLIYFLTIIICALWNKHTVCYCLYRHLDRYFCISIWFLGIHSYGQANPIYNSIKIYKVTNLGSNISEIWAMKTNLHWVEWAKNASCIIRNISYLIDKFQLEIQFVISNLYNDSYLKNTCWATEERCILFFEPEIHRYFLHKTFCVLHTYLCIIIWFAGIWMWSHINASKSLIKKTELQTCVEDVRCNNFFVHFCWSYYLVILPF